VRVEDRTVVPRRESDEVWLVGLLGELVDAGEHVHEVPEVVVPATRGRPLVEKLLADCPDVVALCGRPSADGTSDERSEQPLWCLVDVHEPPFVNDAAFRAEPS
jgi:hypothetical protein